MSSIILMQQQTGLGDPHILIMFAAVFIFIASVILLIICVCRDYSKAKQNRTKKQNTKKIIKIGLNLFVVPETLIATTLVSLFAAGGVFLAYKKHKKQV